MIVSNIKKIEVSVDEITKLPLETYGGTDDMKNIIFTYKDHSESSDFREDMRVSGAVITITERNS
jgi:hypothetical protein